MQLFKGNLKFLSFTTVGFLYDLWSAVTLSLFYSPTITHTGMRVGNLYGTLTNPDKSGLYKGIFLLVAGFAMMLIDHLMDLYKPRRKKVIIFWQIALLLSVLSLILFFKLWTLPIILIYFYFKYNFTSTIIMLLILLITFFLLYKPKK